MAAHNNKYPSGSPVTDVARTLIPGMTSCVLKSPEEQDQRGRSGQPLLRPPGVTGDGVLHPIR